MFAAIQAATGLATFFRIDIVAVRGFMNRESDKKPVSTDRSIVRAATG
jgi:hypothetical protein